jgi:hypothetical protein
VRFEVYCLGTVHLGFAQRTNKLLLIGSCNSFASSTDRLLGHTGRIDQIQVKTDLNPKKLYFN